MHQCHICTPIIVETKSIFNFVSSSLPPPFCSRMELSMHDPTSQYTNLTQPLLMKNCHVDSPCLCLIFFWLFSYNGVYFMQIKLARQFDHLKS